MYIWFSESQNLIYELLAIVDDTGSVIRNSEQLVAVSYSPKHF